MTEVGLATLSPPSGTIRPGSVGTPVRRLHRRAPRRARRAASAAGEEGRLWIKTPQPHVGYWEDPEATEALFRDGWLDSGDLVRADEDGYLWFFGRKKQIIVHDGSNISPQEVEAALVEHPAWPRPAWSASTTSSTARTCAPT